MAILIVGGAGYIGSQMKCLLLDAGEEVIVLDNLSNGIRSFVEDCEFIQAELDDKSVLASIFKNHAVETVMHFAAHIEVGESVQNPAKYYKNNVQATTELLNCMLEHDVQNFIFSSTAAIFGAPEYTPIDESHPKNPINPYGRSKWMVEQILRDYDNAYELKSICLRYFNAAGADSKGRVGECHDPETHLIPLILQAASGRRQSITVFGNDYKTHDGTCIRDYIHVEDLCDAHLLALKRLVDTKRSDQFNLGNGSGFSVKQVIECACDVTGQSIPVVDGGRRPGDPAVLVADSKLAKEVLGWKPRYQSLDTIIRHAWEWEQRYFCGK